MTYKQSDVFLGAEDCKKIAPYVPKELLKGWEWWYFNSERGHFRLNLQRDCNGSDAWFGHQGWISAPALDTQILGSIVRGLFQAHLWDFPAYFPDYDTKPATVGWRCYMDKTELLNRRDAMMYLIDQKLISPVEGREE